MTSRITGKTGLLCLIGDPVEHTMSPAMHNAAIEHLGLDLVYVAFHVKPENLGAAVDGFKALQFTGINVTIPHKVAVMEFLDEIDEVAKGIGAINTIKNENGKLVARNTDADGALKALEVAGINPEGKKVFILGAGGAARALGFALARQVQELRVSSIPRDYTMAKKLAENIKSFAPGTVVEPEVIEDEVLASKLRTTDIVVNATPIGMHPKVNDTIVKETSWLPEGGAVFDMVYNPYETQLMAQGVERGCKIAHGLDMLVYQGALAFEWWTGQAPPVDLMKKSAMASLGFK